MPRRRSATAPPSAAPSWQEAAPVLGILDLSRRHLEAGHLLVIPGQLAVADLDLHLTGRLLDDRGGRAGRETELQGVETLCENSRILMHGHEIGHAVGHPLAGGGA